MMKAKKEKLIEQMNSYAEYAKEGIVTNEIFMSSVRELIFMMSDILKDKETEFFVPVNDNGPMVWDEDRSIFLPMYVNEEMIPEGINYAPIHPCEIFKAAYECRQEKGGPVCGVIVDPGCDNVFTYEGFILDAVVCRYLGFDRFVYINEITGEEKVIWDIQGNG